MELIATKVAGARERPGPELPGTVETVQALWDVLRDPQSRLSLAGFEQELQRLGWFPGPDDGHAKVVYVSPRGTVPRLVLKFDYEFALLRVHQQHVWAEWDKWRRHKDRVHGQYLARIYAFRRSLMFQEYVEECPACKLHQQEPEYWEGEPGTRSIWLVAHTLRIHHWWHHSAHDQPLKFFDYGTSG